MPCFLCGKRVSLVRQLTDADFCSDEHRKKYHEMTRAGLRRLLDTQEQTEGPTPRRKGPGPATVIAEPPHVEEVARQTARETAPTPIREAPRRALPEPPRHPAVEEIKPARQREERPKAAPRRPEPVVVPPPPPPPPPVRKIWEPDFEAGLIAIPEPFFPMDPLPIPSGGIEIGTDVYSMGRVGFEIPELGFEMQGPVWPRINPDRLAQRGRGTPASGFGLTAIGEPYIQAVFRRWPPRLGIAEPGALVVFLTRRPNAVPGRRAARQFFSGAMETEPSITLGQLQRKKVRNAMPSGALRPGFGKPNAIARRSAAVMYPAPSFGFGYYLPALPEEFDLGTSVGSGHFLPTHLAATASRQISRRREVPFVAFAGQELWLPEAQFQTLDSGPTAAKLASVVADWIIDTPKARTMPIVLVPLPAPARGPRPKIPHSRGWSGNAVFPAGSFVSGAGPRPVGLRKVSASMALLEPPPIPELALSIPELEELIEPAVEAADEPPEADLVQLPRPRGISALSRAPRLAEQVLIAALEVNLPMLGSLEAASEAAIPAPAELARMSPPAVFRPRKATAAGGATAPLVSFDVPLLPEFGAFEGQTAGRTMGLAEMAGTARPGWFAPPAALRSLRRHLNPLRLGADEVLLPQAPDHLEISDIPAGDFEMSRPMPITRPGAPMAGTIVRLAVGLMGKIPSVPIRPLVQVLTDAQYAPSAPGRSAAGGLRPKAVGPVARVFEILLPRETNVEFNPNLSSGGCVLQYPTPISGAVPHPRAVLDPFEPAPVGPEIKSVTQAVHPVIGITTPRGELRLPGKPNAKVRIDRAIRLGLFDMPVQDLRLLASPSLGARHVLYASDNIVQAVTSKARPRKAADAFRQDLPTPETLLPRVDSGDRRHALYVGLPFRQSPTTALLKSLPKPPMGAMMRQLSAELPAPSSLAGSVHLDGAPTTVLAVRSAAWKREGHTLGWEKFPKQETRRPGSQPPALGRKVLAMSGLEIPGKPAAKVPATARRASMTTEFPLAAPIQPASEPLTGPQALTSVPPASVRPAAFRGTPQSPWKTSASIPVPSTGLPGCPLGVSTRLHLTDLSFEASTPARPLGAAAKGSAKRVTAPVQLSDALHQPVAHLAPVMPRVVSSADLLPKADFPPAQKVSSKTRPTPGEAFPLSGPVNTQSHAVAPRQKLMAGAFWSVAGRSLQGWFRKGAPSSVDMLPQAATMPGQRRIVLGVKLTSATWEKVAARTQAGKPQRTREEWQALTGECTAINYRSAQSVHTTVEWPTRASSGYLAERRPMPAGVSRRAAPFPGLELRCPDTRLPQSAGFRQALKHTQLAALAPVKHREDARTSKRTIDLQPAFRPVRRPGRMPVFVSSKGKAVMPSGAFIHVGSHEDHDDSRTMGVSASYEAAPLDPRIPSTRHSLRFGGDLDCTYFVPTTAPAPNRAFVYFAPEEIPATAASPELRDEISHIPMQFDPAMAEENKGLAGAFKSASRFFKFMLILTAGHVIYSTWLGQVLGGPRGTF